MKTLTLLLFFVTAASLSAQTKQIAHRSHSGTSATFVLSATPDNLGLGFNYEPYQEPDTLTVIDSTEIQKPSLLPPAKPLPAIVPAKPAEPEPPQKPEPQTEPSTEMEESAPSISKERSSDGTSRSVSALHSGLSRDAQSGSLVLLALGLAIPAFAFAVRGMRAGRKEDE